MISFKLANALINDEHLAQYMIDGGYDNSEIVDMIKRYLLGLGYIITVQYEPTSVVVQLFIDGKAETFRGSFSETDSFFNIAEYAVVEKEKRDEECKSCTYYVEGSMSKTCYHCEFNTMYLKKEK
jgi:hypothetical protein